MSVHKEIRGHGPSVAIIGAGIAGLSFAIALKRQLGFENFKIFERASAVGGVWRDNVYPGCASDVAIHFYSLSTDLNPHWNSSHAYQDEIQAYWKQLCRKYFLYPHLVFNSKVISAQWDAVEQLYHIITEDTSSGTRSSTTAQIVISAVGNLDTPRYPKIPGISTFKGDMFHSARWNAGLELRGKRVAVIGNGASATQFVPIISADPSTQVIQFCRTPSWFLPSLRTGFSPPIKWAFKRVPLFMRTYRIIIYLFTEMMGLMFISTFFRGIMTKFFTRFLLQNTPSKYHDKLLPTYPVGCKRMLFDSDYLSSLHRPNLELNWDGIAEIVGDGIVTKKGMKLPFDVMIFSTGFAADEYPLMIRGRTGQSIQEYYQSQGGPKAYLGTTTPGFPNFYMLSGPNAGTGHTSLIFIQEVQINYCIQLVKPILEQKAAFLEVTPEATDAYNDKLNIRLARSVFTQCTSWYRLGGDGKIFNVFPGPVMLFWWWLRRPIGSHYVGDPQWTMTLIQRGRARLRRSLLGGMSLIIVAVYVVLGGNKVLDREVSTDNLKERLQRIFQTFGIV